VHRGFVRQYRQAASAAQCAEALEKAMGLQAMAQDERATALSRSNSPRTTARLPQPVTPTGPRRSSAALHAPSGPRRRSVTTSPGPSRRTPFGLSDHMMTQQRRPKPSDTGSEVTSKEDLAAAIPERSRTKHFSLPAISQALQERQQPSVFGEPGGLPSSSALPQPPEVAEAGTSDTPPQALVATPPPVPHARPLPASPKEPPPERRFIRSHRPGSSGGNTSPASAATEAQRHHSQPSLAQLPPSDVAIPKAAQRLWGRGWTLQEIADLFDLEPPVVVLLLSRQ